jgi:hypothetical protein
VGHQWCGGVNYYLHDIGVKRTAGDIKREERLRREVEEDWLAAAGD